MPNDQSASSRGASPSLSAAGEGADAPDDGPATAPAAASRSRRRHMGAAAAAVLLAAGAGLWGVSQHAAVAGPGSSAAAPPLVTAAVPLQRVVTNQTELTGQFSPVNQVVLLAQVSGYLTQIHFRDGQIVHKGDLLFVIDPRPYEIQLQQATAQYQSAMAAAALADKDVGRSTKLSRVGVVSVELLDQSTARQQAAQGAVKSAQAAIDAARLNLQFTRIVAPFDGRMSMRRVSLGSLVSGGSTALSTIVSLDPIHLDVDMSEADYVAYQKAIAGRPDAAGGLVPVSLDGETSWARTGRLDFLDNQIDRGSGTLRARATLSNADLSIAPGQFGRIRVPGSAPHPVLLVPDAAIATDQSTKTVMVVGNDGVVAARKIEIGVLGERGLRVVTQGLLPTDRVVVNGLMRARPGLKVTARLEPLSAAAPN